MNRRIKTSQFFKIAGFWLSNLVALLFTIGLIYLPPVISYWLNHLEISNSPNALEILRMIIYGGLSLAFPIIASINLRKGPSAIVKVLRDCIPSMTIKEGKRLVNQWFFVLLTAGLVVAGIIPFGYFVTRTGSGGQFVIALMFFIILLMISLPTCGLLTSLAIRRIDLPLAKKDLALLPALYLVAELPGLAISLAVWFIQLVLLQEVSFNLPHFIGFSFFFAILYLPVFLFYGIGGAIGSVLMFLRLNRSLYGKKEMAVPESSSPPTISVP